MERSSEQINERSPDLFSDDDENEAENEKDHNLYSITDVNDSIPSIKDEEKETSGNCIEKTERAISKRVHSLLAGILPPPSVTYIQYDIGNLLSMYKRNIALMDSECEQIKDNEQTHIPQPPPMPKELENVEWPEAIKINAYGVHYNRTKYTENIEIMYMKLVERNVGQETGTSFTYNASMNAKKKPIRKLYV